MNFLAVTINREGGEPANAAEIAWLCIKPIALTGGLSTTADHWPEGFEDLGDVMLTVRQPSLAIEGLDRNESDPHPDDATYDWPNLPKGLMKP